MIVLIIIKIIKKEGLSFYKLVLKTKTTLLTQEQDANTDTNLKFNKLRHCVIFPKGPPFSIFTAVTFHYRVREGSMWIHYAIKHLSQILKLQNLIKFKISIFIDLDVL